MRQVAVCVHFERSGENGNSHETVTNEAVTHLLHCGEREEPPPPRNPCQMGQKPSLIPYPKNEVAAYTRPWEFAEATGTNKPHLREFAPCLGMHAH